MTECTHPNCDMVKLVGEQEGAAIALWRCTTCNIEFESFVAMKEE